MASEYKAHDLEQMLFDEGGQGMQGKEEADDDMMEMQFSTSLLEDQLKSRDLELEIGQLEERKKSNRRATQQILETSLDLHRRNQEETAFRFRLTETGDLVPGSVTTLRRRLVTAPS